MIIRLVFLMSAALRRNEHWKMLWFLLFQPGSFNSIWELTIIIWYFSLILKWSKSQFILMANKYLWTHRFLWSQRRVILDFLVINKFFFEFLLEFLDETLQNQFISIKTFEMYLFGKIFIVNHDLYSDCRDWVLFVVCFRKTFEDQCGNGHILPVHCSCKVLFSLNNLKSSLLWNCKEEI